MRLNETETKLVKQARAKIEKAKAAYLKRYHAKHPAIQLGKGPIDEQWEADKAASNEIVGALVAADNALVGVVLKEFEGVLTQPPDSDEQ